MRSIPCGGLPTGSSRAAATADRIAQNPQEVGPAPLMVLHDPERQAAVDEAQHGGAFPLRQVDLDGRALGGNAHPAVLPAVAEHEAPVRDFEGNWIYAM